MPTRFGKFLLYFLYLCEGLFDVLFTIAKGVVLLALAAAMIYIVGFIFLLLYALIREEPWVLVVALIVAGVYAIGRHLRQT